LSTLGKIFTVLNVIAAIVLCMLVVAYVKSSEQRDLQYENAAIGRKQATDAWKAFEAALGESNAKRAELSALYTQELGNKAAVIEQLRNTNSALDRDKAQQMKELNELRTAVQGLNAGLDKIKAEKDALQEAYDKQVSEATVLRQVNSEVTSQNQDLKQMVIDLKARIRGLEVQLAEIGKENTYLKQNAKVELPKVVPALPTVDLHGVIREVDNNTNVAEISLGSSDQVVENMKFLVYRGNDYLADLIITKVDENTAVGRLEYKQGDVRRDDNVTYTVRR
jgi:chromosome segregation ATPase